MENQFEKQIPDLTKEKPKKIILEIGANKDNSALKQYQLRIPEDAVYVIENVDYAILPNEPDTRSVINRPDSSVDEVVMSNVLSDLAHFDFLNDKDRIRNFWKYRESLGPMKDQNYDQIRADVAVFQKKRTLNDVVRVLKTKGVLRIYENYNQFHPNAVTELLEWLAHNSNIEFTEDIEEEHRIQPILDKDNQDRIDFYQKYEPSRPRDQIFLSRKHNKVYKAVKK